MFFRRPLFGFFFLILLLMGISGMSRQSSYSAGYQQGFAAAQQAQSATEGVEASEGVAPAPEPVATHHHHGHHWGIFGIFGFFFKFWLMMMVFGFFMKMFGFRHWKKHGHRCGGDDEDEPYEKQPEDVEPQINGV